MSQTSKKDLELDKLCRSCCADNASECVFPNTADEMNRHWPVGEVFIMEEKDGPYVDVSLVQIVAYLHETDSNAPTEVVYKDITAGDGLYWSEEVSRVIKFGWFKDVGFVTGVGAVK